jgi:hypothetical protein
VRAGPSLPLGGRQPMCEAPQLGSIVTAPLAPHAEHRAERRSMWLEPCGPQRITMGAIATGAR